ncbi:sensor histidine kinase [Shewanella sp. YIC-542]|uniref:sensor histidine kinase n=1 Tax=Shewanella mytili TaxID=3377111 RepID=UPI00398E755E
MNSTAALTKLRVKSVFVSAIVLVLALLSGITIYHLQMSDKNRALVSAHSEVLNHASLLLYQELAELEDVMRLISSNGLFMDSLRKDTPVNPAVVADVFVRYGKVINDILQLRWLDDSGMERVRVKVQAGRPFIVPAEELQPKANRYYFVEGMKVAPPQQYISPLDLNIEHQRVVVPFEPTIRISMRTGGQDGLRSGLLIINYNLGPVLEKIGQLSQEDAQLQLSNAGGYWIVHPDEDMCWGQDLQQPQLNLAQQLPGMWALLQHNRSLVGQMHKGQLFSFQHIPISQSGGVVPAREFALLATTPAAMMSAIQRDAVIPAAVVAMVIVLLGSAFVIRDYQSRSSLLVMAGRLQQEMAELQRVNRLLDNTLKQQQMLKNDLAESKRLSSLGMMVAGISHELNTPIGGAQLAVSDVSAQLGQLQSAMDKGLTKGAMTQFLQHSATGLQLAEKNLTQANIIIKSFRRLTLARAADEIQQCIVSEIVTDLFNGLTPLFKKRGIRLINNIDPQLRLWSQAGILSQVLQNLLLNAVEHAFDESTLNGSVTISAQQTGDFVELMVTDNGKGVKAELREHIFDPFVTSNRAKQHTGLGLHLVHQWVTQCLMGQIYLASGQHGATFVLRLPKGSAPASSLDS